MLTRKQYYNESGIFASRRHIEHWNRGIKEHIDALSTVSSKGSLLQNHAMYLDILSFCYKLTCFLMVKSL